MTLVSLSADAQSVRYLNRDTLADNCSNRSLVVGGVTITDRQTSGYIPMSSAQLNTSGTFRWRCGGSNESSKCPSGTTHLRINRNHEGRRFTSECLERQSCAVRNTELDRFMEACSRQYVSVLQRNGGKVSITDRQVTRDIPNAVNSTGAFSWRCAAAGTYGTSESSNCPAGTTHVSIDRTADPGPGFRVECRRIAQSCQRAP